MHAEYDKALKKEAAGLRHVGEVASMATHAIFQALGLAAVVGTGGAALGAVGAWGIPVLEGSTGVSASTWAGTFGKFALGVSFGGNLIAPKRSRRRSRSFAARKKQWCIGFSLWFRASLVVVCKISLSAHRSSSQLR